MRRRLWSVALRLLPFFLLLAGPCGKPGGEGMGY
jgi:hypothetical protein